MSSPTTPKRFFLRHARSGSLPQKEDQTFNEHLTDRGITQAIEVGRGSLGDFARDPETRIFCSTYDRAIETLLCVLDPKGGPATVASLRKSIRGREATKVRFSDERFVNLQVPLPEILKRVTFDRELYDRVSPELRRHGGKLLVVGHYDAGKNLFDGKELLNAQFLPF
jgi:broad specificity phosphatase PhoE